MMPEMMMLILSCLRLKLMTSNRLKMKMKKMEILKSNQLRKSLKKRQNPKLPLKSKQTKLTKEERKITKTTCSLSQKRMSRPQNFTIQMTFVKSKSTARTKQLH